MTKPEAIVIRAGQILTGLFLAALLAFATVGMVIAVAVGGGL